MLARPDRRTAAVCGVTGTNVLVAVALWLTDGRLLREPVISSWHARAWTLALMFALTEAVVLHVQMGRETPAISLSEIPLVLGLVYASPVTLLATRFVGSAAVLIGYRRQPPLRAAYNLAVQAAEASVALAVFGALSGPPGALPPRTIVAVYAAVLSGAVLTGWSLRTVIGVSEGSVTLRGYLDGLVEYPPVAIGVATLGFVAAYGLRAGADGAWALVVTLAGLLGGYRLYGRLRLRHESLERLFDFTQSLPDASESQEAPHRLLDAVRTMMNAEYAALVLTDRRGGPPQVVISRPDDLTAVSAADDRTVAVAVHERLLADRQPVLHPRSNRPGDGRAARPGVLRDLVATSLDDGTEPLGSLIVANRVGSVQTFTRDDLQLLQTVSRQAAASVRNLLLIEHLRYDATHDPLTGLANRAAWEAYANAMLAAAPWDAGEVEAIVLMDLDGFKDVNDTFGHHHGDELLMQVARRLATVVGSRGVVARFGGDEFAVFLPRTTREDAGAVADSITRVMQEPVVVGEVRIEVQGSAGIAFAPAHGVDVPTLLKRSDLAMYASKRTTNRVTVFHDTLENHGPNRLALMADLRRSLADGGLTIAVQPKASVMTGEITGVEVLARWHHASEGEVVPEVFIPLAERSGMIRELTAATLDRALGLCRGWRSTGLDLSVAVNLSPRALLEDDLLDTVSRALTYHWVPPQLLTLEITESSVIADPEAALVALRRLRELGVRLSVDDFGTGYSSLSYLKRLPVQEVKIDRSFVRDLAHDQDDEIIVRAVADLGRSLNLEVVAEGVEDVATWRRLQEIGCTTVQGFYLGRPMPPTHFGTWLRRYQEALAATTAAAQLPTLPSAPLPVDPIPPQRTRAEAWLN